MSAVLNVIIGVGGSLLALVGSIQGDYTKMAAGGVFVLVSIAWEILEELAARNKQEGSK